MTPFTNDPIPIDEIPQLTDDAFVSVDPRYLRASLVGTAITAVAVLAGGSVLAWQTKQTWIVAGITAGVLVLVALYAVLSVLGVRRLAYQVREHDISRRSGVISHQVESLPFARVQHVRVNRGAIERALGLATLQISSAGPNITIPGLAEAEASRIKLLVTQRAGMDTEDEGAASAPQTEPTPTLSATPTTSSALPPGQPPLQPPLQPLMQPPTEPPAPPAPPTPPATPTA